MMLHYAELDTYAPPPVVAEVRATLGADPRVLIHEYPQVGHGFAREGSAHYNARAADLARRENRQCGRRAHLHARERAQDAGDDHVVRVTRERQKRGRGRLDCARRDRHVRLARLFARMVELGWLGVL
jgi:hypothetical protein